MSLAPVLNAFDVVWGAEVVAVGRLVQPAALAGLFAGLSTGWFAAVMLAVLVAVIGLEKLFTTTALASLWPGNHRRSKTPPSARKQKLNPKTKPEPMDKKEEGF